MDPLAQRIWAVNQAIISQEENAKLIHQILNETTQQPTNQHLQITQ